MIGQVLVGDSLARQRLGWWAVDGLPAVPVQLTSAEVEEVKASLMVAIASEEAGEQLVAQLVVRLPASYK